MLRKRIIFTLIYENGFFNQSRNFRLQKVGDINWLERNYKFKELSFSLDEIMVLDATKENKNISEFSKTLERIVDDVFIPVSAGGGIRSIKDAEVLFNSGADKVVLNTVLVEDRELVVKLIKKFGSQGQQKSFLIALKLAQFDFLEKQNTSPILLLDDIFDKLDDNRVKQIVNLVNEDKFKQIFISDTNKKRTENAIKSVNKSYKIFEL